MLLTAYNDDLPLGDDVWKDLHALLVDLSNTVFPESRTLNAIPSNVSQIEEILEDGGTRYQDYNRSVKDLQWLEEHGQCMDNIAAGNSTIDHAGRGAFATRFIPNGGLVSPAPLVHIKDIDMMVMFPEHFYDEDEEDLVPDRNGPYTWQLLLNYCFGHQKSTLLLCPYGLLSSLINHSSGKRANTKLQWSEPNRMRHPEWLEKPIEAWGSEYHTGLQLDFVATRDIEEGEEILIDYGDAWQASWDQHVSTFRFENLRPKGYRPSFEVNNLLHDDTSSFHELRTVHDRDYRLDGLQMHCRGWYLSRHGIEDLSDFGTRAPMCTIIKKLGDEDSYVVRILDWYENDEDERCDYHSNDWDTAWGIPRDAFFFEDLPYSRDMHQEWAFRHPMMIPTEIFPEIWKNANNEHEYLRFQEKPFEEEESELPQE